jgi:hypothetical protein
MDQMCLGIIDPPFQEKIRDEYMPDIVDSTGKNSKWMPKMEPWRVSKDVGIKLDNIAHIIRANSFRVNPSALPTTLYHYNVGIFRYDREGNIGVDDLAKENEKNVNTAILKEMVRRRDDWKILNGKHVGFSYDGKSSLYTSARLQLKKDTTDSEHFQTDVTYPPNANSTYHVIISLVAEVHAPSSHSKWFVEYRFLILPSIKTHTFSHRGMGASSRSICTASV